MKIQSFCSCYFMLNTWLYYISLLHHSMQWKILYFNTVFPSKNIIQLIFMLIWKEKYEKLLEECEFMTGIQLTVDCRLVFKLWAIFCWLLFNETEWKVIKPYKCFVKNIVWFWKFEFYLTVNLINDLLVHFLNVLC